MAAELRMGRGTSAGEREAYVDGIISRLGLAKVCVGEGLEGGRGGLVRRQVLALASC